MSTRSGKRIHGLILEEGLDNLVEQKTVRKTRNKQDKENVEIPFTNKKRKNYVSYPSEEDIANDLNGNLESIARSTRKSTRNTLKEQNLLTTESETSNDERKIVRVTRRTKKFDTGDSMDALLNNEVNKPTEVTKKVKRNKTKKTSITEDYTEIVPSVVETVIVTKKKSNKKKKKSKSNSMTVDDIPQDEQKNLNRSIVSVDSFHSAAGSPLKETLENDSNDIPSPKIRRNKKNIEPEQSTMIKEKSNKRKCKFTPEKEFETFTEIQSNENLNDDNTEVKDLNSICESISERKSSLKQNSLDEQNITFEAKNHERLTKSSEKKRKSKISLDQTDMVDTKINGSYEVLKTNSTSKRKTYSLENQPSIDLNGTLEKEKLDAVVQKQLGSSSKKRKSRTNLNTTYDTEKSNEFNQSLVTSTADNNNSKRKSGFKDSTYDKIENTSIINLDDTYDNEKINQSSNHNTEVVDKSLQKQQKSLELTSLNSTYDKISNTASPLILNNTLNNIDKMNTTYDKEKSQKDSTFDKSQRKSSIISSDTTDSTSDMTEDNSRISITSDKSKENIVNTTPMLIESSLDESQIVNKTPLKRQGTFTTDSPVGTPLKREGTYTEINPQTPQRGTPKREKTFTKGTTPMKKDGTYTEIKTATPTKKEGPFAKDKEATPLKREGTYTEMKPTTPLKREGTYTDYTPPSKSKDNTLQREGTFTKDEESPKPDIGRRKSLASPGCTPFPNPKQSKEKNLNITHSIEKRKSIIDIVPRTTKVMFCSPVNNPGVVMQMKRKIIKSNLKGSNKSFVFDESVSDIARSGRKRSYTQSEAEQIGNKRKRLTEDQQQSVDRLARPRTTSASARLQGPSSPKKTTTPTKSKSSRTKLPNFAVLHQKQFEKMESLDECQERKAKRARTLLTPTGSVTVLERISPKESKDQPDVPKKVETPKKQNDQYTRFGFKLNLDVNPFSVIKNTELKKQKPPPLKRQATLPSLHGATVRKNVAKLTIMREKSFTEKRSVDRKENRTVIKGVRTNRRFELQMKMRNIEK